MGEYPLMNAIRSVLSGGVQQMAGAPVTTSTREPYTTTTKPITTTRTTTPWTPATWPWTSTTAPPRPPAAGPRGTLAGAVCAMGQFHAHESDCAKFYQCDRGRFAERRCKFGQHWKNTRCVRPEDARCSLPGTPTTIEDNSIFGPEVPAHGPATGSATHTRPVVTVPRDTLKGAPCSGKGFRNHESNCAKFYQCKKGLYVERLCF